MADADKLILNWDFTKSLVDTENSQVAVLNNGAERSDEHGVELLHQHDYVDLGPIDLSGKRIVVNIDYFNYQSPQNARSVILWGRSSSKYYDLVRFTNLSNNRGWLTCSMDNSNHTYVDADSQIIVTERNIFNDNKVILTCHHRNHLDLTIGDAVSGSVIASNISEFPKLVSLNIGNYCNNMYISSVQVYEPSITVRRSDLDSLTYVDAYGQEQHYPTMGQGVAKPATSEDLQRDTLGFTDPNLHRRIDPHEPPIVDNPDDQEHRPRSYTLDIGSVHSYRTTEIYLHDEDSITSEIP